MDSTPKLTKSPSLIARDCRNEALFCLCGGPGVLEVHICEPDLDGGVFVYEPRDLIDFVRDWNLIEDIPLTPEMFYQQFVGIVHENGAVLCRIDNLPAASHGSGR